MPDPVCEGFQAGQGGDLVLQLGQRAGAGGLVDELFFQLLDLGAVEVLDVVVEVFVRIVELDAKRLGCRGAWSWARCWALTSLALSSSRLRRRDSDWKIASGLDARRRCSTVTAKPTRLPRRPSPSAASRSARPISSATYSVTSAVERHLQVGQLVGDGVGAPLGKQRAPVEAKDLFLHHAPHQVRHVGRVDAVADLALEPVRVEQRHEELEVLLLAGVRRRRHQQEVSGGPAEHLAQPVALGLLDLVAEVVGGHAVRLVDHDEIPLGRGQTLDQVVVAGQVVEPGNQQVALTEGVAGPGRLDQLAGQDREVEPELVVQLVLPLADEPAGSHDQGAAKVASQHQLLDVEPGHDRLAGAGVVGEAGSAVAAGAASRRRRR